MATSKRRKESAWKSRKERSQIHPARVPETDGSPTPDRTP